MFRILRAGAFIAIGYMAAKFVYNAGYMNGKWDSKGE